MVQQLVERHRRETIDHAIDGAARRRQPVLAVGCVGGRLVQRRLVPRAADLPGARDLIDRLQELDGIRPVVKADPVQSGQRIAPARRARDVDEVQQLDELRLAERDRALAAPRRDVRDQGGKVGLDVLDQRRHRASTIRATDTATTRTGACRARAASQSAIRRARGRSARSAGRSRAPGAGPRRSRAPVRRAPRPSGRARTRPFLSEIVRVAVGVAEDPPARDVTTLRRPAVARTLGISGGSAPWSSQLDRACPPQGQRP